MKIRIFNTEYEVVLQDTIEFENETYLGLTHNDKKLIQVATKNEDGSKKSEDDIRITLIHEIIHACLNTGMYREESRNEALVEWLANCIMSLVDQKAFNL